MKNIKRIPAVQTGRMGLILALLAANTHINAQTNASINGDLANPTLNFLGTNTDCASFGSSALFTLRNTGPGGADQTALGHAALYNATGGAGNVAIGKAAQFNSSATPQSIGIGFEAMYERDDQGNTAVGTSAMYGSAVDRAGLDNTGIGYAALISISGANDNGNSAIGSYADVTTGNYNQTAIGNGALTTATDQIWLGNGAVTVIQCAQPWSPPSDQRFKFNIDEENVKGLEFIQRLKPVVYNYDGRKFTEIVTQGMPEQRRAHYLNEDFSEVNAIRQSGFIAQEVEAAAAECSFDFDGVYKPTNARSPYGLSYGEFVVPLVKAVKQQQTLIEELELRIDAQDKKISELADRSGNNVAPGNASLQISTDGEAGSRIIKSTLSSSVKNAKLVIYDASGKKISAFRLTEQQSSTPLAPELTKAGAAFCAIVSENQVLSSMPLN